MIRRVVTGVLLGCAVCLAPGTGGARTMQQKLEAACAVDIADLCPHLADDPIALKACMLTKRSRVSAACMALVDASE